MTAIAVLVLMLSSSVIMALFWYMDAVYALPTPVPNADRNVEVGSVSTWDGDMVQPAGGPLLIHQFDPACPCSRFNLPEVLALVRNCLGCIAFGTVVMPPTGSAYSMATAFDDHAMAVPSSFEHSIAPACGVGSSPQPLLLDTPGQLYYRDNYNGNRYCTALASKSARKAIDLMFAFTERSYSARTAGISHGCSLSKGIIK